MKTTGIHGNRNLEVGAVDEQKVEMMLPCSYIPKPIEIPLSHPCCELSTIVKNSDTVTPI